MENTFSITEIFDEFLRWGDYSGDMINNNTLSLQLIVMYRQ